tara:strand:- start:104 stop:625 length:522 start_codon:yes stop_codon:yes gene_type:complete
MADGTFAALMILLGLGDMQANYCETDIGCLGRSKVLPRAYVSSGGIVERRADAGPEVYFRYDLSHRNGPFGHAVGVSVSSRRETWVGVGQTYLVETSNLPLKAELHAMSGLYDEGDGHDLGGRIAFRSGIDLIYETTSGTRYALSYDHRSHIGIYSQNPGMETIQLAISLPLN